MEEQAKKIADLLKMLANENRLLILCSLIEEEKTVGEIHQIISTISTSALSQHLNHLKLAGILDSEKKGLNVFYKIKDERVTSLIGEIKKYYCAKDD